MSSSLDLKVYPCIGPEGEVFRVPSFDLPDKVFNVIEKIQQACEELLVIDQVTNGDVRAILLFLLPRDRTVKLEAPEQLEKEN